MDIIETYGLTKEYPGRTAVADLNLTVRVGEIYGFLGPNGAGKTTTIRMLTGILPSSRGSARVVGYDLDTERNAARANIGLLPESVGCYEWMTPLEYLGFFAELYDMHPRQARNRVAELLERVGLTDRQRSRIGSFSRGMRARLGIARALVHRPRVLFLDEPTLGLDPLGQRDILELVGQVNAEDAVTVFLSSHSLDQVGHVCARVGILNKGRLAIQGTPDELRRELGLAAVARVTVDEASRAQEIARRLPDFAAVTVADTTHLTVASETGESPRTEKLVHALVSAGVAVREVVVLTPTLEDVFFALVERERRAS